MRHDFWTMYTSEHNLFPSCHYDMRGSTSCMPASMESGLSLLAGEKNMLFRLYDKAMKLALPSMHNTA